MERLAPGDAVRFGGRFGTPIADGIATGCDRFVGVATGAGLGPLVGYAEAALAQADGPARIELYCAFRDLQDVWAEACESLAHAYPSRFSWTPVISRPMACTAMGLSGLGSGLSGSSGLISEALSQSAATQPSSSPPAAMPASPGFVQGRVTRIVPSLLGEGVGPRTHYHLVGNGQFVNDFRKGLLDAGVGEARVTTETYFNGKAEVNEDEAAFLTQAMHPRLTIEPAPGHA